MIALIIPPDKLPKFVDAAKYLELLMALPKPERIPARLQAKVDAYAKQFENDFNHVIGKSALRPHINWLALAFDFTAPEIPAWSPEDDFLAKATCLNEEWGTAAKRAARRQQKENRRLRRAAAYQGVNA